MIRKIMSLCLFAAALLPTLSARTSDETPARGVFNVFTYNDAGALIGNTYGFFISPDGIGLTSYALFNGARRAEVIDAQGNKYEVDRILGANSTMDVLKLRVKTSKTTEFFPIASAPADDDAQLLLVNYSTKKKTLPTGVRVTGVSEFRDYRYYDLTAANNEANAGCPLLNSAGEVVAMVQKNVGKEAKSACAIDARVAKELETTSISAINSDLARVNIPAALPDNEKDALSYVYLLPASRPEIKLAAMNDFIAAYPANAEGYVNRGTFLGGTLHRLDEADADFTAALSSVQIGQSTVRKADVHFSYSKLLLDEATATKGENTTLLLEKALAQADSAYALSAEPIFLEQRGEVLILLGRLNEAAQSYAQCNATDLATPQTFFRQAQILQASGADSLQVLAALDGAVGLLERPFFGEEAATIFFNRAVQREKCGMMREAVADLGEYEKIVGPQQLNANFYALRSRYERCARMFQQSLDDIRSAESRSAGEDYLYFRLEEVSLLVQVQLYDEAIASGEDLLKSLSDEPALYRLLSIAHREKGNKKQAAEYQDKAQALEGQ